MLTIKCPDETSLLWFVLKSWLCWSLDSTG